MEISLKLLNLYASLFARPAFRKLNSFVLLMGMRGLGIFNWRDMHLSGELGFLRKAMEIVDDEKNPIALDIGANQGDYSNLLLQYSHKVRIYAFEPHPITFKYLQMRYRSEVYSRLKLYKFAIGSTSGKSFIYDKKNDDGSPYASLFKETIEKIWSCDSVCHPVELSPLDSLLSDEEIEDIAFIKIDIEGAEKEALLGAKKTLSGKSLRFIQIEFNEMNAQSKCFLWEIVELIPDCFSPYRLLPGGKLLSLDPWITWQNEIFGFQNVVFIRDDCVPNFAS